MVLATEMILPPRRHSFNGPEPASKSPPKSTWWFLTAMMKPSTSYGGSTHKVATQKLRESKWFEQDEERLFCAVIESGFIVEIMQKELNNNKYLDDENKSHYGIVSVEAKKSKCRQTLSTTLQSDGEIHLIECQKVIATQIFAYVLRALRQNENRLSLETYQLSCGANSFAQKYCKPRDLISFFFLFLFNRQEAYRQ